MDRRTDKFDTFIDSSKDLISNFFSTDQADLPRSNRELLKNALFELFEVFKKLNKKGIIAQFDSTFINNYLSKEIIKNHPTFSKTKIVEIQIGIKKFLNYLYLQNIIEKKRYRILIENLNRKTTLKRKIDEYSKLKKKQITDKKPEQEQLFNTLSLFYKSCLTSKSSIKTSFALLLDEMGVSKSKSHKAFKNNLEKTKYNLDTLQENLIKKYTKEIKSPSYYFPDKKDHILKNWFSYELSLSLFDMLKEFFSYHNIATTPEIILLENYVKFCFNLSVRLTQLITRKTIHTFFSKDLFLKEIESFLEENHFFQNSDIGISKIEIIESIYRTLKQMLKNCQSCSNHCLNSLYTKCTMFKDPFYTLDLSEKTSSNHVLNKVKAPVLEIHHPQEEILEKTKMIYLNILKNSKNFSTSNFTSISVEDLKILFKQYNKIFFSGLLNDLINKKGKSKLMFRLSSRMTKSGGSTSKLRERDRVIYTITISSYLLFQSFSDIKRTIKINGIICNDRIEALQRIFEHELIHLIELLLTGESNCSSDSFKKLAKQFFFHTDIKHDLITQEERTLLKFGIKVGDTVSFEYKNKTYIGIVDRITKRATVLVKDNENNEYANREGFLKFYIPISKLNKKE